MGLRADLKARHVKPDMRGTVPIKHLSRDMEGDHALFEIPHDREPACRLRHRPPAICRASAEMLRRGGELDGVRILSPRMLELARQVQTGDMPNELYRAAHLRAGLGSRAGLYRASASTCAARRSCHHQLGTLTSPETFGNYGAGSTLIWVDPELDVSASPPAARA